MDLGPVKKYLEARDSFQRGQQEQAARQVVESLGAGERTYQIVQRNLGSALDQNSLLGEGIINLVIGKCRGNQTDSRGRVQPAG